MIVLGQMMLHVLQHAQIVIKMDKKAYWIIGIVLVVIIGFFIIRGSITGNVVKEYCGDDVCNGGENKCTCSSDCGNCWDNTENCGSYECDYNNQCVMKYARDNCCGNNKCEKGETCSSCSKDCGTCQKITDEWAAIERVESREDIKQEWETLAKQRNCAARYLDVSEAVYSVARVTLSQNLIECSKRGPFYDFEKLSKYGYGFSRNKEFFEKLSVCSKDLIETYNKALRGYDSSSLVAPLEETCDNCDDFYAIHFGCIDADVDIDSLKDRTNEGPSSGIGIYIPSESTAFVVVDSKTGIVYW